ncbi:hypothetical protein ASF62_06765 [Leifsonia sp. Leaf325]|nr:NAD(P)H-dependent oxidoreductase [Leifsonia sp. Leaf325]KQQ93882.1 hypothetical protein ASF62_06765 [Leifsonia sp. Leaf325]
MTSPSNTLIVIGHPIADSFNHAVAAAYADAARESGEVRVLDLADLDFELSPDDRDSLRTGREGEVDHLDAGTRHAIELVRWADHLVFVYPQWWGTYPAVFKAFIDRVFVSGFAFRYGSGHRSEPLLGGRTARVVMTMDSPTAWNRLVYRNASETSLIRATLRYCGIRTVGVTRFAAVRFSTEERRAAWLDQARAIAQTDAARSRRRTGSRGLVAA